jgi:hypothetical protein
MSTPRRLRPTITAALAGAQHTTTRRRRARWLAGSALALVLAIPAMASGATVGAQYTYSPTAPVTGKAVTFNAAGSTCGAVIPCSFTWEDDAFDGSAGAQYPLGSGQTLSFTFKGVGTKNVRLKVYDKNGTLQAQTVKAVNVTAPPTTPPPTTPPPTTPPPTTPPPTTPPPTTPPPTTPPSSCSRNATTSTFAAQVSAATAGQVICLAAGSYGTWTGTNKTIIVRAASGAAVTMGFDFTTGDSGFTVDGVKTPGGNITNGAKNITVRNSSFSGPMILDGLANANILLDHNTHNNISTCSGCAPARVALPYSCTTFSGVTVSNSTMSGGNADGIQAGCGLNILNNTFDNIHESGPNDSAHTDPIQLTGAPNSVVKGNYIHNASDGIVAYDGLDHATITDNVIDLVNGRWGIELYADNGSIVSHNTLVYGSGCEYAACGWIILDRKSSSPTGKNTTVTDNIATAVSLNNGSTATKNTNNMVRQSASGGNFTGTPTYTKPGTYAGYHLTTTSPGTAKATDRINVGIR